MGFGHRHNNYCNLGYSLWTASMQSCIIGGQFATINGDCAVVSVAGCKTHVSRTLHCIWNFAEISFIFVQ